MYGVMGGKAMIWCPRCGVDKIVIGFSRDDPILSCGHVKLLDCSNVAYCFICDKMVSIFVDGDGVCRCAGNLFDAAGCGCELEQVMRSG